MLFFGWNGRVTVYRISEKPKGVTQLNLKVTASGDVWHFSFVTRPNEVSRQKALLPVVSVKLYNKRNPAKARVACKQTFYFSFRSFRKHRRAREKEK